MQKTEWVEVQFWRVVVGDNGLPPETRLQTSRTFDSLQAAEGFLERLHESRHYEKAMLAYYNHIFNRIVIITRGAGGRTSREIRHMTPDPWNVPRGDVLSIGRMRPYSNVPYEELRDRKAWALI